MGKVRRKGAVERNLASLPPGKRPWEVWPEDYQPDYYYRIAKVGMEVVNKALQILGGYGYINEFPIERMYRDIKGIEIGAGTTQIQKLIIARELLAKFN